MFADQFRNKKVLITGNTGFKGSWLSLWLFELGAEVFGLSNGIPTDPSLFDTLNLKEKYTSEQFDITDATATIDYITRLEPDFIFHLAAQSLVSRSYASPLETVATNVLGTCNVLEAIRLLRNDCVAVIITSDKCYDNVERDWGYSETDRLGGKDVYSGSKGAAELIFRSYFHSFFQDMNNIQIGTTRAGNVVGGGDWAKDRIVADCMLAWAEGKPVEIRSPGATRPWQHVLEPLSGYLALAQNLATRPELSGESYNFGPRQDQCYTVLKLLEDLHHSWKSTRPDPPYTLNESEFHEAGLLMLNCDKALKDLQWLPTLSFKQLIEFTSNWYQAFYNRGTDMHEFTRKQIAQYENLARHQDMPWTK